ncbi:hypothetical protein EJ357_02030 [Streptomyces cyaneochromogenes]|uniref:Uncharacterized protein n=1 Tax=Streptomyces cyaneochromogenes TaxID=2496836 RepID=A0A3Q9ENK5_9ACTN|nr:hypothetical protein [Streptomyces cyaneochromogenes]AZQ32376.1 hypothetical protein EJ357_02030 [Streptomyces cyaneochromogenes]
MEYRHDHVERAEVVVESTGTGAVSALGSAAEVLASDEPVPAGNGAELRALSPGAEPGSFTGLLDGPPGGRDLVLMLTLSSGRVTWERLPLSRPLYRRVATDLDGTRHPAPRRPDRVAANPAAPSRPTNACA